MTPIFIEPRIVAIVRPTPDDYARTNSTAKTSHQWLEVKRLGSTQRAP